MDAIISIFKFFSDNWQMILGGVNAVLVSLIAIFLIIPGDQPEKFLQGIVDFITKISKKKP